MDEQNETIVGASDSSSAEIEGEWSTSIIAVANQKGGVGKTTTSVNLAAALAVAGRSVLLVDSDPQGNATSGLGVDKHTVAASLYDVLCDGVPVEDVAIHTGIGKLWMVPANTDLVGAEMELASFENEERESCLKDSLASVSARYDYIFIDCPPSLGLLTVNAFTAANSVLVPLQCEYYALEGISSLLKTIEIAQRRVNPDLELEGVVLTMYDARTNLSRQVESESRDYFGDKVFRSVIPRNVKLSESPSFGQPIISYDPQSLGAGAYDSLARELEYRKGMPGSKDPALSFKDNARKTSKLRGRSKANPGGIERRSRAPKKNRAKRKKAAN